MCFCDDYYANVNLAYLAIYKKCPNLRLNYFPYF